MSIDLAPLSGLRAILVTGKGGVGKTTIATALARAFAMNGKRALVCEIASDKDTASPIARALGAGEDGSDDPTQIEPNLRAVVLQPTRGHTAFLRDALPIKILADAAMKSAAIRRFLMAAPSLPEMGTLYRILELVRQTRSDGTFEHDVLLIDLPATGHALALAQIPSSLLTVLPGGPIVEAVREGLGLLTDPKQTGAVVVTLPEVLPVSESLELVAGIQKYEIPLACCFMNRVPYDPFDESERAEVGAFVAREQAMLGARSFSRIERAKAAMTRLSAGVRAPIVSVAELDVEGPAVSLGIAEVLARGVT